MKWDSSGFARCGALLLLATATAAVTVKAAPAAGTATDANSDRSLSLTIYNSNLALIEHVRVLRIPAGRQRIEFKGVSAQIIPQTVSVVAADLGLIEQNFDYDLLTPQKLMDKAVGKTVRIVRTNPGTGAETSESAEVLSTTDGVVLRIGQRIEVLRDDGIPARVIFDQVPDNLRASPTLSILADAGHAIDGEVRLSYLSHGLGWQADYVAVFDESKSSTSLQGWITLTNTSGTSFNNAHAQLVAGDVNVVGNEQEWWQRYRQQPRGAAIRGGMEPGGRPQLADYYLYPIALPTTIANNQTKQVSFLSADKVAASKGYELVFNDFSSSEEPVNADVRVRFGNARAAGLGEPLPAGVVRVYARDGKGQPQFVGEDHIEHTAAGSELALKIGQAFDVTAQPTVVQNDRINKRETDTSMIYLVRNARSAPVTVTIRRERLARFNSVVEESLKGRRTSADSLAWDVPVPANGEATLKIKVRESWW